MRNWLMNGGDWRSRILWAPPGEGGTGDGNGDGNLDDDDDSGDDGTGDDDGDGDGDDSDKDDEINLDGADLLAKMFGDDDGEESFDLDSSLEVKDAQTLVGEMNTYIKEKVNLPEATINELIPENFNPADRNQATKFANGIMQLAVRHALQASFMPTKNAMASQQNQLMKAVKTAMQTMRGGDRSRSALESEIPAATHPNHGALVRGIHKQSMKLAKNDPAKAYGLTRKALKGMGIDPSKGAPGGRQSSEEGSSGVRTGMDALDIFAPIPRKSGSNKTTGAMRRQ